MNRPPIFLGPTLLIKQTPGRQAITPRQPTESCCDRRIRAASFDGPPKDKLDKLVDGTDPYPDKPRPHVEEHDIANSGLRRYGSKDDDSGTRDKLKPGRTGMIPTD